MFVRDRILRALVVALSMLALASATAGVAAPRAEALPAGPAPVFKDCLGHAGPGLCVAKSGYVEFSLGKRVLHVGDTVTGTYQWGPFPYASYSAGFSFKGAGLRLVRCTASKGQPTGGVGAQGQRTCTWRAVAPTSSWQIGPSITLGGSAGAGSWPDQDFYVVLGREMVIEGRVTRKNTDQVAKNEREGIPGVPIRVHGPQSRTVRTNANGYYVIEVTKSGRYRVTPTIPAKYGGPRAVTPRSRVVAVSSTTAATADFEVADDLQVELAFDTKSVPANGFGVVKAKITAKRWGKPVPGLVVSVMPFGKITGIKADSTETPVPARICQQGYLKWPTVARGTDAASFPFDVTLDQKGTMELDVRLGTVPGAFKLEVRGRDAKGLLRFETGGGDTQTIANEALASANPNFIEHLGDMTSAKGVTFTNLYATVIAEQLATMELGRLAFTPIYGSAGTSGVLVHDPAARMSIDATAQLMGVSGSVFPANHLQSGLVGLGPFATFTDLVIAKRLPELMAPAAFAAGGTTVGWTIPAQDGTIKILGDQRGWLYAGYPHERGSLPC